VSPVLSDVHDITAWFRREARDLPWRRHGVSPYAVLVSEIMLQQTPVARVLTPWEDWVRRWPDAASLAAAPSGEAVRQWGRLGYPRRALRLHAACVAMVERHGGQVPSSVAELLALPGVGTYTARAVAAFAFGARVPVVDVNVRRVLARAVQGEADGPRSVTQGDLALVESLLPLQEAPLASVALMELGALVCTARAPQCGRCPVAGRCAWLLAGSPAAQVGRQRARQTWTGTDRQVRGLLMAVLRASTQPIAAEVLQAVWDEPVQRSRALAGLLADGLARELPDGGYALPA
jgi:A/G-specific adenine glycosylase